ncbi:hypothetical protein [uncultured Brevundimonas sp.]|uniref:hypothetical protein n=1 Tax=uncultured Brevundimonas sp. TaxID=213418 RepID=UPI0026120686|nr:hypothetical protein [uncultured Brevundimonas sp.]
MSLKDGAVTGDGPISRFELLITPDLAEVDRIYMGLSRAGEGFVLYGPGLKGEGVSTTFRAETDAASVAVPSSGAIDGYVFVGPRDHVTDNGDSIVIAEPQLAPELDQAARRAFSQSLAFYKSRLNLPLTQTPVLAISVDSPGPSLFRGDVTDTGVISIRFKGEGWRSAQETVAPFVWHETFHLWNGHGVRNRDGDTDPWLHEGSAEYAAITGAVSNADMSEDQARAALSGRLNGCRRAFENAARRRPALRSGSAVYDCGTVIQWIADLELRRTGQRDFFSLWSEMLETARGREEGFGTSDFQAALPDASLVRLLLDDAVEDRWDHIREGMTRLGVMIANAPGDKDLMMAALFHVAKANCPSGSYGFYNDPGALKLDGENCGPLSGEPVIDAVEGFDPQGESRAMFVAVQSRCDSGLSVRYRTRDGRTLEAACPNKLPVPQVWQVAEAPAFAR